MSESDHTITVKRDGNLFCALCGPNLQEGIAGFGPTISDALHALADVWFTREPAPPAAEGGFARSLRQMHEDRESLGRIVRAVWIAWAKEQPNQKPSWLSPWEELSEPEREVDRRIGATIADFAERSLRQQLAEVSEAIGTSEFMDPPDGGDVSLAEQVRRMRQQLDAAREANRSGAIARSEAAELAPIERINGTIESLKAIQASLASMREEVATALKGDAERCV